MSGKAINCPTCTTPVIGTEIDSQPVWLCPNCGETIIKTGVFKHIFKQDPLEHTHNELHDGRHTNCPGCGSQLSGTAVADIEMEHCSSCDIVINDRTSISKIIETGGEDEGWNVLTEMDNVRNREKLSMAEELKGLPVEDMFVMFRNGILLTSYSRNLREDMDKDIVGSMLIAITDFIRTSFKDGGGELSGIRFKDREIAFEHGAHLVVAMVMAGTVDDVNRSKVAGAIRVIEAENKGELEHWAGNLDEMKGVIDAFKMVTHREDGTGGRSV